MNKPRYYILSAVIQDANGKLISPSKYELDHTPYHYTLTNARKSAVTHPLRSMAVLNVYLSIDGGKTARWIGLITHEAEKNRRDMFTVLVYTSPKGTWYLNKNGTLGKRFPRKVLYKSEI